MNVQSQYNKVQSGELKQEYFLQEAFKDVRFKRDIVPTNSYEDVVTIFKNKGYIQDETSSIGGFDLLGTITSLKEDIDFSVPARKKPELDVDHVNYYEYQKGWRHELESCKNDIEKAKAKALKNINDDDIYYTRLQMGEKKPTKRDDVMIDISKKNSSKKDDQRQLKPVKGTEKHKAEPTKAIDDKAKKNPEGVKVMKEGLDEAKPFRVNPKYNLFAIDKTTNKIVNGWEMPKDYTNKEYMKDWGIADLKDMDVDPKSVSILGVSALKSKGIDPFNWDSWRGNMKEAKPSAGLSARKKSDVVKKAEKGEDIGKKGKGFEKVAKKAEKEYGSKEAGEKVAAAAMWKNIKREAVEEPTANISDLKKKYASPSNPAVISFTFQDPTKNNEVVQYEGRVKDIVKSKTPGAFVLKMQDDASIVVMKDTSGQPAVVYMPKNGKDPIKNPEINVDDEKIFDDILGIGKEKVSEETPLLGENDLQDLKEQIKTLIRKKLSIKEYMSEPEKEDEDDAIKEKFGNPEIEKILDKWDYLGFDYVGQAMVAILTTPKWEEDYDVSNENPADIEKVRKWKADMKAKYPNKKGIKEEGNPVDKAQFKITELKRQLRNINWDAFTSNDTYQKKINQESLSRIKTLVKELGDDGKAIYNAEVPDSYKIQEDTEGNQVAKDYGDMRPEDLADLILKQDVEVNSQKPKIAAQLLVKAMKDGNKDKRLTQALHKISDAIKK